MGTFLPFRPPSTRYPLLATRYSLPATFIQAQFAPGVQHSVPKLFSSLIASPRSRVLRPTMPTPLRIILKTSFKLLATVATVSIASSQAHAQGCVAIKQMGGGSCNFDNPESTADKWDLNVAYQHFRSHR